MSQIRKNLEILRLEMAKHAKYPEKIHVVVVTKNRSREEILEAIASGASIIGENTVDEAEKKLPFMPTKIQKHFIGHLQTNKVRRAVKIFDMIQSVDSMRLAEKIDREGEKLGKIMPVLLQINIASDPKKFGFDPEETRNALNRMKNFRHLRIEGLMTIGTKTENIGERRKYFRKLSGLFHDIEKKSTSETANESSNEGNVRMRHLSMGMSQDYRIALEEGATMIRIGNGIFE